MPEAVKAAIDDALTPATAFLGWFATLAVLYLGRRWFVRPGVAVFLLILSLSFLGASLGDRQFAAVALTPDAVAVWVMLYLLAFFTWLATAQAVQNDDRWTGLASEEASAAEQERSMAPVWPDLVASEIVCASVVLTLVLAWSLAVPAPLEQPANPALTPNPAKAPWYFLGVQEMLFWLGQPSRGVAALLLAVAALMALPYVDRGPATAGCYTIRPRRTVYLLFQSAFWLTVLLTVVGIFLRGADWGFFGPYRIRVP
ncbi:MAG: hypothetical protein ABFC96_11280 [Thermoguttaceae bacterium]